VNYIDETSNKQFVLEFCGGKEARALKAIKGAEGTKT